MNTLAAFFYEHAGYSYDPKTETPSAGRRRCARALAKAERAAAGRLMFTWQIDQEDDSSSFSDARPAWPLWNCCAYDRETGKPVASLCAIDFGRDGRPQGSPYSRVVEAELAAEVLS